jgi:hypothetical protein
MIQILDAWVSLDQIRELLRTGEMNCDSNDGVVVRLHVHQIDRGRVPELPTYPGELAEKGKPSGEMK